MIWGNGHDRDEIASIRPPQQARRPGHDVGADGAAFECWPEKLNKVGQRYAVEVETREWQGRPKAIALRSRGISSVGKEYRACIVRKLT
jgi:hypothetical protein